ncbi:hypothetical protein [Rhodoblastus sp.]|uniref:hypothetical protein n=1 Tax=Rhodoblastus sp. TaxID=1962975 RepID=UPI003F993CBC
MQTCIRIALIDDREFAKCLRIIAEELRLDDRAFEVQERRPDSVVICFDRVDHAKLFGLYYALDNSSKH